MLLLILIWLGYIQSLVRLVLYCSCYNFVLSFAFWIYEGIHIVLFLAAKGEPFWLAMTFLWRLLLKVLRKDLLKAVTLLHFRRQKRLVRHCYLLLLGYDVCFLSNLLTSFLESAFTTRKGSVLRARSHTTLMGDDNFLCKLLELALNDFCVFLFWARIILLTSMLAERNMFRSDYF